MSVPGADLSPAADQLGLGPLLTQQTRDETDEERRKRLLEQPRRRSCHCSASAVLVRCGADDRWAYSARESVQFSNISATNRPLAFLSDDIGSLLKGGAKVCQRQLVNEVLVPLAIEFAHNWVARARHLLVQCQPPNGEFCGPTAWIRCGSFKISQSRLIISRSVCD